MKKGYVTAVGRVCFVAAICVAVLLPAVTAHETPPPYPSLEPNDGVSSATDIQPRTLHGLEPIKFTNATPGPAIDPPPWWALWDSDRDVYAVELEPGDALPVTTYHDGANGSLEATIHDPSGTEIGTVQPDSDWKRTGSSLFRSDRDIQRGNTTVTAGCSGTHYVAVSGSSGERIPYRLEVDDRFEQNDDLGNASLLSSGTYEDLMISTYDEDYYRLAVDEGEVVTVDINITPHAHWEWSVSHQPVRHAGRDVTAEEWAPYDHPRWEDPSFHFESWSGLDGGDLRVLAVSQVENDELHRDKLKFEVTSSGTAYIAVRSNIRWTSAIDGASKWRANSARYNMTITRDGGPSAETEPPEDDEDPVRSAFERLAEETSDEELGLGTGQLAGEVVTLDVADGGVYSFEITEEFDIAAFRGCGREDATVRLETDRGTIDAFATADDPTRELLDAYRGDDLTVDGLGTVNAVKWTVVNGVSDVAEWVSF